MEWRPLVLRFLEGLRPTAWVFPGGSPRFGLLTNLALRTANPDYTVRAIRRGALQAMAADGAPDEVLVIFSGHRNMSTLWRYLKLRFSTGAPGRRCEPATASPRR